MLPSLVRSLGPFVALAVAVAATASCGSSSSCITLPCPKGVAWDAERCACGASDAGAPDATTDAASHDASADVASDSPADSSSTDTGPAADSGGDAPSDAPSTSDAPAETSVPEGGLDAGGKAGCLASGGTLGHALCCNGQPDFPDTCAVGACGCAPNASSNVQVCNCPAGMCFDGTQCH
jgi:hypothetical protein